MRIINIQEYDENNMSLAKPVFDSHGRLLLAQGSTINHRYLEKLINLGIRFLMIEDQVSRGITMKELIDATTWIEMVKVVRDIYHSVGTKRLLPVRQVFQSIDALMFELVRRPVLIPIPSTAVPPDLQLWVHVVNVTMHALQIGRRLGYNQLQLQDLAVGCLLHDIGKVITDNRFEHPEAGFNFLRKQREISLLSAHVAYQHHEKVNGLGFPRGLSKQQIVEYSQICGISNEYDNKINQELFTPHEAFDYLMSLSDIDFPQFIVIAFAGSIPSYIPGTVVRLTNGDEAIVTRIGSNMQRPYIRFLLNGEEICLVEHPTLFILEVL